MKQIGYVWLLENLKEKLREREERRIVKRKKNEKYKN